MLRNIASDKSTVIPRAEKRRVKFILKKQDYIDVTLELLNDTSTYTVINKDLTFAIRRNFNALIDNLAKSGKLRTEIEKKSDDIQAP